jgi:23S rRNA pseudouridine2457 synthase
VPDCWLEIIISEGKNRQVRRMTAKVGLPTLRLVRAAIGPWQLGDMQPGELRSIEVRLEDLPALSHAERLGKPAAVATAKTASTAGKPRPQASFRFARKNKP